MIIKERIQKADGTIKYRNYLKQDKLGKGKKLIDNLGGFAECFLVQRMQDKRQYALKIIPKKLLTKSKARQKVYLYGINLDAFRNQNPQSFKTQKYL